MSSVPSPNPNTGLGTPPIQSPLVDLATGFGTVSFVAWLNAINVAVTTLLGGAGGTGIVSKLAVTLTGGGAQAITTTAPTGFSILVVILAEDATGGTTPAWGAMFSTNTPENINTDPLAVTVVLFAAAGGIWQYAGAAF